jgi:dienelactone hydrolase
LGTGEMSPLLPTANRKNAYMAQPTKSPARKRAAKATPAPAKAKPVEPAAVEPAPSRAGGAQDSAAASAPAGFRWRAPTIVFIVAAVLAALLLARLGAQEREGPAHTFASVRNVPATLYVPEKMHDDRFPNPKPVGQRPPLVVVAHGFSADQQIMSTISRSLAAHGFAVLAIDFRGHGSNTHAFEGDIIDDLKAALDWADTSPYVDHTRYAVLGHSMGASAALEFASRDPRVKAVVPVSGGDIIDDTRVPTKILFLDAENDPSQIKDRQDELVTELNGKTDLRHVTVKGKDHVTILFSNTAIRETVNWLDDAFGTHGTTTGRTDGRLGTVGLYMLMALVLIFGAGLAVGRLAPAVARAEVRWTAGGQGLLVVIGALIVAMPLIALGSPASFIPAIVGDAQVGYLGLAGGLLFVGRALARRANWDGAVATRLTAGNSWFPDEWRGTALAGLAGAVAVYVLLLPLSVVFHRLVPTPERFVIWVVATLLFAPIYLASEALIRRGTFRVAVGWGIASRIVTLIVVALGIRVGFLPGFLSLILPILAIFYLLLELFAAGVYRRNANVAAIAFAEAALLAWLLATSVPVI